MTDINPATGLGKGPGLWPVGLLLYMGITWSLVIVCGKFAINEGISPYSYTSWTMIGAALFMTAIAAARRSLPRLNKAVLRYLVFAGATRVAVPNLVIYIAITRIPVGLMSIVLVMVPIFTYLMALAIRHEKFTPVRFAGILLGLAGALLIVLPRGSLPDPSMIPYVILAFLTPFLYSVSYLVIERHRPAGMASTGLVAGTLGMAALMLLPVALIADDYHMVWPPFTVGEIAIGAHVIITSICFLSQFELIRLAGSVFASQSSYLSTIAGVTWGMVFFAESHSPWVWAALALVLAGVVLVNRRAK